MPSESGTVASPSLGSEQPTLSGRHNSVDQVEPSLIPDFKEEGAEAYVAKLRADILKSLLSTAEAEDGAGSSVDFEDDSLVEDLSVGTAVHDIAIIAQAAMGLDMFGRSSGPGTTSAHLGDIIKRLAQTPPYGDHARFRVHPPPMGPIGAARISISQRQKSSQRPSWEPIITIDANGQKRFQCPQCSKSFARAYNLNTHLATHDPDPVRAKPYFCTFPSCLDNGGRHFSRKHDLQRHITSTHDGEYLRGPTHPASALEGSFDAQGVGTNALTRRIRCDGCGRGFVRRDGYLKHKCNDRSDSREERRVPSFALQYDPPFMPMANWEYTRSSGSPAEATMPAVGFSAAAYEEAASALISKDFASATAVANRENVRRAQDRAAHDAERSRTPQSRHQAVQLIMRAHQAAEEARRGVEHSGSGSSSVKQETDESRGLASEESIDLNSHIANLMKAAGVATLLSSSNAQDGNGTPTVDAQISGMHDGVGIASSQGVSQAESKRKALVLTDEEKRRAMEVLQNAMLGMKDSDSDSDSDSSSDSSESS